LHPVDPLAEEKQAYARRFGARDAVKTTSPALG